MPVKLGVEAVEKVQIGKIIDKMEGNQ